MKNLIIFAFLIMVLILVQFAQGQTVDDIIDKYIIALGGKENLVSLRTVIMEGRMSAQGFDLGITNTIADLVGLRLDIDANGILNYQVADTTKGAVFWPSRGMTTPEDMEHDEFISALNKMDLQGILFNYKGKGNIVELTGKETVDGVEAYHLKIICRNGVIYNYYIDTKTYMLVKTSEKQHIDGQEKDVVTTYSDYRKNADGYWFPYVVTIMQGTINYEKISANIPVNESIFRN